MTHFLKKIIKFIVLFLLLIIVGIVFNHILVDDAEDHFRGKMINFYNQESIDVLFLGSSHVFCGVNTDILEEKWNKEVYLASTSVQKPDVSYYLLKEAVKKYEPKTVFLDMCYFLYRDVPNKRTANQLKYIYCVSDYMNWSWDKIKFIWDACPLENMIRAYIPAVRYGDNILDFEYLDRVIKSKNNDNYRNPVIDKTDKGYRGGEIDGEYTKSGDGNFVSIQDMEGEPEIGNPPISDYSLKYLNKIIDLCKKENIELIFFTTPMTDFRIGSTENYDSFFNYVTELSCERDIPFWDFNLLNPQYGEFTDEMHSDDHHLNALGAHYFSDILGDYFLKYENEINEDVFCKSVKEKINSEDNRFYGVKLYKNKNEYSIVPIQNGDENLKNLNIYHVYVIQEENNEKEEILIKDNKFEIDKTGIFLIEIETIDYAGNGHQASIYQDQ